MPKRQLEIRRPLLTEISNFKIQNWTFAQGETSTRMRFGLACDKRVRGGINVKAFTPSKLRCRPQSKRIQVLVMAKADGKSVWAFDFDGVVCDSVHESALAAWKAAERVWPGMFSSEESMQKQKQVLNDMQVVRPVVETGYENIVQVRSLLDGESVDNILENWPQILSDDMEKWNLERSKLVEVFGQTRDDWMKEDMEDWLNRNPIYEILPDILQYAIENDEAYIVTTKQARFTEALLKKADIPLSADRIYSQAESGKPKTEVLKMLQERHQGTEYHFVEDKLSTLLKVIDDTSLEAWQLYLVDWGYNTFIERKQGMQTGRIEIVDKEQLQKQVKKG